MPSGPLNTAQVAVLRWLADGNPCAEASNSQRLSARALASRRLLTIKGHGAEWVATLTESGQHYLDHGDYPEGHFVYGVRPTRSSVSKPKPERTERSPASKSSETTVGAAPQPEAAVPATKRRRKAVPKPPPEPEVEVLSPAEARRRGKRPDADELSAGHRDAWDEKIMITVKEAAWMLSLPEGTIRDAAIVGDVQRVFIGNGTKNYRIVYGSLLAWVNTMPREPGRQRWWR